MRVPQLASNFDLNHSQIVVLLYQSLHLLYQSLRLLKIIVPKSFLKSQSQVPKIHGSSFPQMLLKKVEPQHHLLVVFLLLLLPRNRHRRMVDRDLLLSKRPTLHLKVNKV